MGEREVDDGDWRLRKSKNLVKLLALAPGHRLHREQLLEVLWPDQDPDSGTNNLHKAIYTARRALEPELAAATPSTYLLVRSDEVLLISPGQLWVDAEAFEHAAAEARRDSDPRAYQAALDLYAGELLPEDRYEDWAAGPRESLQSIYLNALLELAQAHEHAGEAEAAIDPLRRLVAAEPSNEEARVALMRLHAQIGQRHQALRQYQHLRAALMRDLDVEPAPATQQLYQDIAQGQWVPDRGSAGSTPARPKPVQTSKSQEPALVGRDREIDLLEDAVERLFGGRGQVIFVAGEAGIGKSRLSREMVDRVTRRGGTAMLGAAYEHEGRLPYGPFADAFRSIGGLATPIGVRAIFGEAGNDLSRLPESQVSAFRSERQRLFAAVSDALRRVAAGAPLILVLEDLQFADEATHELLHYLARTTLESPILILATFRVEEAPPISPTAQLVAALQREQLALRVHLERLPAPATNLLVSSLVKPGPIDRKVFEIVRDIAAGNPLYTEELLRTLRDSGRLQLSDGRWELSGDDVPLPGSALQMISARIAQLDSSARQVLMVAAVAGQESDYALLRGAAGLPDSTLLDALDACIAHGVLKESSAGYVFGHPLQRAAAYENLSRARRTHLHGTVAAVLEDQYGDALDDHAEKLAHHWSMSQHSGRAVSYLIMAGDRAAAVHTNQAAEASYRRSLDLLDAPGVTGDRDRVAALLWEKLGDLLALAAASPEDEAAYITAADRLQSARTVLSNSDSDHLVRLYRKAAHAALTRHAVDAATQHLAAAEALLDDAFESPEWPRVRLIRALWFWERGMHDQGRQAAEDSLRLARERDETLDQVNAYMTLALVFHSSGSWKEGLALEIEQAGRLADANPRLGLLFDAHLCLGEYHLYGDSAFETVEAYARQTLERAKRAGAVRAEALTSLLLGESLLAQGQWDRAAAYLEQSLTGHRHVGSTAGQALALHRLAELRLYRGELAFAEQHLHEALALEVDAPMAPHVYGRLYATLASHNLLRNDAPAAVRAIEASEEIADRVGQCITCNALVHPVATDTYVAVGDVERAREHATAAEAVAAHWESGAWRGLAERAHGRVRELEADYAGAEQHFLRAAEIFERNGQTYDTARCLVDAARVVAANGGDEGALLSRAQAIFDQLLPGGGGADAAGSILMKDV
ncbi:MAG: AAA family ATPase [Chloroflexi bacterium]|nr:AAA family ATPase [Chloroflexota bacterium]